MDQGRRELIAKPVDWVTVFPGHLEVKVPATPPLNVLSSDVGLMGSDFVGVGELAALGRPELTDQRFGDVIPQQTTSSSIKVDVTGLVLSIFGYQHWAFKIEIVRRTNLHSTSDSEPSARRSVDMLKAPKWHSRWRRPLAAGQVPVIGRSRRVRSVELHHVLLGARVLLGGQRCKRWRCRGSGPQPRRSRH